MLDRYLSRAVTHAGLLDSHGDPPTACLDDDVRMLTAIGAKFVGRAAFVWDLPADDDKHFARVAAAAQRVHDADPDVVLQACVFEIVTTGVDRVPIPAWVFEAFGLPVEQRSFAYDAMLYRDGHGRNKWRGGASVPDMSQLETRLWFYYRARRYIDAGCEAIHFGQVMIMDDADPGHRHWLDLLGRVRAYAHEHARRHLVLCDAHTHGEVEGGKLLFDFHSFPMRLREVAGEPMHTTLAKDQTGDIFGRSSGGVTPSGWSCDALPYLVELDNYGYSGRGGQHVGGIWVWGYDEISWFAHLDAASRDDWLRYAYGWIAANAPNGHLQMPTRRMLAAPTKGGTRMYQANARSAACPRGFGVEATIRAIWRGPDASR
ncbi:MAG: hypothetical protein GC159_14795 [Phycisphaera sp.]|nr:hypothetical protein [Phycisphaera sp.]